MAADEPGRSYGCGGARGEVWRVAFDLASGGEIQQTHPAVVLSNDTANALLNRIQMVLVSSQIGRLYSTEAFIGLNSARRKAMADRITTVSKWRLIHRLGSLSPEDLGGVMQPIGVQQGF